MAWIWIFRNLASLQVDCCLGVAHIPFAMSQVYDCLQKQLQYKITCLLSLVQRNSYCPTSHNCFPGGVQTPMVMHENCLATSISRHPEWVRPRVVRRLRLSGQTPRNFGYPESLHRQRIVEGPFPAIYPRMKSFVLH